MRSLRVRVECLNCIAKVRSREIVKLVGDSTKALEYTGYLYRLLGGLASSNMLITRLATICFRLVKQLTGVEDPYRREKDMANRAALQQVPTIRERLSGMSWENRFRAVCVMSVEANILDIGIPDQKYDVGVVSRLSTVHHDFSEINRIMDALSSADNVYMLLDNCGEAVIDGLLAEMLRDYGCRVTAVVKSRPFQDDVTIREFRMFRLLRFFDDVLETGSDASSIIPGMVKRSLIERLNTADLIIAKGMAHYETLTDEEAKLEPPVAYLLKAKCDVIARSAGVKKGDVIVRFTI